MYTYTLYEWVLIFYIYCFLGWIIESSIVSYRQKRFVNRGFLKIPMLPIYGSGAVIVLIVCLPLSKNIILIYFAGMILATVLEYFVGYFMEKMFKIKYWDYSNDKYNFRGRICLESSLFWGILSVVLIKVLHKPINILVLDLESVIVNFTVIVVSFIFVTDFVYSFCNVVHFNRTVVFIDKIKHEIQCLQHEAENAKTNTSNKAEYIFNKKSRDLHKTYKSLLNKVSYFHVQLTKSYPKASSKHFSLIKELKEKIENRHLKK